MDCEFSGCVPADRVECPSDKFYRDSKTCVDIRDCTCKSHDNKSIKPGVPVRESECELCQCLRNKYACDDSICQTTTVTTTTTTTEVPSTTTVTVEPPMVCDEANYTSLINGDIPLSDAAFHASSYANSLSKPSKARLKKQATKGSAGKLIYFAIK